MAGQFGGYGGFAYGGASYAGQNVTPNTVANDPTISVLFETSPNVWVDLGADLMSGNISRGKTRELDAFSVGTAQLTLRNDARQYDPNNATGPYFGSLVPMKRIQVLATTAGVTYSQFKGYVDTWNQVYTGPHSATATVYLSDALKIISKATLPVSAYYREVSLDSPISWWRLGDPLGSATACNEVGGASIGKVVGTTTFGERAMVTNDGNTATSFGGSGYIDHDLTSASPQCGITGPFTVTAVIRYAPTSNPSNVGQIIYGQLGSGAGNAGIIQILTDGDVLQATVVDRSGNITDGLLTAPAILDGQPHHLAVTWNGPGTMAIYLDGVAQAVTMFVDAATSSIPAGSHVYIGGVPAVESWAGDLQDVIVFNGVLSAARIAAHSSAVFTPWAGDSPATRAGRILDVQSWPAADRQLSTGQSVLQSANIASETALDHLQLVADSEFGKLYVNASGAVVLESRDDGIDQPVLGTFVDSHNGTTNRFRSLVPEYTDQLIRNDVIIARVGGVQEHVTDAASVKAFLLQSYTKTGLIHNSDDTSASAAAYIVAQYKNPLQRVSQLVLEANSDLANLMPQVLSRELTDWVTIIYTPQGIAPATNQTTVIEGIKHEFTPKRWVTTWLLSPADTNKYWKLGDSTFGQLGVSSRLFF